MHAFKHLVPIASALSLVCSAGAAHPPSRLTVSPDNDSKPAAKIRRAFDPATGRDLLHYPPHRIADIKHIKLDVTVPDMNKPFMLVTETLRFAPIGRSIKNLSLDAVQLNIRGVTTTGRTVAYSYGPASTTLDLTFDPPVPATENCEVQFTYEVSNPAEGVVWTPESPLFPGRAASFHTQGEPESNRYWIVGHDFPNERLTSEVVITVPAGYTASSNGRELSRQRVNMPETGAPGEMFHFLQDKEHAPYLIAMAVGKYDVVDVGGWGTKLPMPVYAPQGKGDEAKTIFARTPKMIALYERLFNEPYAWDKYAQVVVTNFAWGGMENTSCTHLYEDVILDKTAMVDGDQDELICHELAHQWFGDLLTCKSWEHIWLNEGWATYCEALWAQYRNASVSGRASLGVDPAAGLRADNDAYQYAIWNNFQSVIEKDEVAAPYQPAMVSKEYAAPDDVFDREANPYPKGASVLHMLRRKLGDKTFFGGVTAYVDAYRNQPVETFQFRESLEKASGLSLYRFFDQWCYRPGVPELKVTPTWNADTKSLDIAIEQLQNIDGYNPAFFFDLTVVLTNGSTVTTSTHSATQTRSDSWSIPCEREPTMVAVNPDLDVLAEIEVVQPAARFVEQLKRGPTLASKLHAAQQLGLHPPLDAAGISALSTAARDSSAFYGLRIEALKALGKLASPEADDDDHDAKPAAPVAGDASALAALQAMKPGDFSDSRVRKAWIEQLGHGAAPASDEAKKAAARSLLDRWTNDRSYAVRAESLRSLGKIKSAAAFSAFELGLRTDSHSDQIRQGAIDGLRDAAYMGALEQVLPMLAPNHPPETRQAAIKAAIKLADQDRDRVFNVVSAIVNEAELRTRRAAVEGLIDLNDPRSRPIVEQFIAATQSEADRLWAADKLRRHNESPQASVP